MRHGTKVLITMPSNKCKDANGHCARNHVDVYKVVDKSEPEQSSHLFVDGIFKSIFIQLNFL